ncbi:hypothetical protein J7L02_04410 [Candidatus Woesearchaeota archaeon]|nr:hypothetical protein [Candidatus Woesearchaeota archaeon]
MQLQKVLADKPIAEITLRKYEKPLNNENKRLIVKKICLSLGLLQPGDSRDVIVDVLLAFLQEKNVMSSQEVEEKVKDLRKEFGLPLTGVASSNIRRQLLRLRELMLIEKVKNKYRLSENLNLTTIFEEKIERYLLPSIVARVKEYLALADKEFGLQ